MFVRMLALVQARAWMRVCACACVRLCVRMRLRSCACACLRLRMRVHVCVPLRPCMRSGVHLRLLVRMLAHVLALGGCLYVRVHVCGRVHACILHMRFPCCTCISAFPLRAPSVALGAVFCQGI